MKIPSELKIGPYTIDVVFPTNLDGCGIDGCVNLKQNIILLDDSTVEGFEMADIRVIQTLFHEVLHILIDMCQIDLEEAEVDTLATMALSTLVQNGYLNPTIDGRDADLNPKNITDYLMAVTDED